MGSIKTRSLAPAARGAAAAVVFLACSALSFGLPGAAAQASPDSFQEKPGSVLGASISTWSFGTDRRPAEAGVYGRAGIILGLASRLELELFTILEGSPRPLGTAFAGAEFGLPLFGPRTSTYFNTFLSLGWAARLSAAQGCSLRPGFLSLRLAPLCIGNPAYGRRDRIFTLGTLYSLESQEFSFTWSFLAMDFFLKPTERKASGQRKTNQSRFDK